MKHFFPILLLASALLAFSLVRAADDAFAVSTNPATAPSISGPRNLLNPDDCEIIAAPSDRPALLLEGGFDLPSEELALAIYGFKDARPVTLTAVRIFINGRDDQAVKSVELLGADSPDGPFTSVLKVGETKNLKMFKTGGWQEFTFDPVRLTFFRINAVAHNHAWVKIEKDGQKNGLQFIGEPSP
jgi:hypothetical protein